MTGPEHTSLPKHIAIIMDGNRRWAKHHKLSLLRGHEKVANQVIEPLVDHCIMLGIAYVTLWAFSTENWHRDTDEVNGIMELFRTAFSRNTARLHKKGVRLQAVGNLSRFPADIQVNVDKMKQLTAHNQNITVTLALNYGGRDEILRAARRVAESGGEWTEAAVSGALDTAGMPDPDLIIRPGGEQRLSGFLPWQSVYSELYFTDVLMPDFTPAELDKALAEYAKRQRRFGT